MTISDRLTAPVRAPLTAPTPTRAATQAASAPLDSASLSTPSAVVSVPKAEPAKPVGAVADFAAQSSIVAHQLARELCPGFVSVALGDLGSKFQLSGAGFQSPQSGYDSSMVWTRDYLPTHVRKPDGELKVLKYLSDNPRRSGYSGADYIPVQPPKPGQEFFRTPGATTMGRWLDVETLPLKHEDGNLVSTGSYAFLTDRIFDENAKPTPNRNLVAAGYKPRQPDEVLEVLSKGLEMSRDQIVIMPKMPAESTGHVDMYVMALGERKLLLPQIEQPALDAISYPQETGVGKQVQIFLDQQAERLQGMGFQVERLPMMPPNYLQPDSSNSAAWRGHFYSPTNSLLVNLDKGGAKEAILPAFDAAGYPDHYKQLNNSYQERWKTFFQGEGYEAKLVDATRLGQANGLFRCITHPIPA